MKKTDSTSSPRVFLLLIALMVTMSINAQVVKVYENGNLSATYVNTPTNTVEVVFEEAEKPEPTHEYVDLGLPSGTLWATCNIGANSPEEYGDYFAWGETTGYSSGKTIFSWETYKWCNGTETSLTKYCIGSEYGTPDYKYELDAEDDAAYANWGSDWCMPSESQIAELWDNCRWTWTTLNGVNGITFVGTNGNSIFLPAAGGRYNGDLYVEGSCGGYWGRTLFANLQSWGCGLFFNSEGSVSYEYIQERHNGLCVRPVYNHENDKPEPVQLVTSITLNPTELTLTVGSTSILSANVEPADADNKYLRWSSDNELVVIVADSIVVAKAVGTATITCAATDGSGVTATCTVTVVSADTQADNLLSGNFSISPTKQVQFTKGNLYWDGCDFKFEANQTDYPTSWDANHVGHLYWTATAADSYAETNNTVVGGGFSSNEFFIDGSDADHRVTVEGISGLYVLSSGEWEYLIYGRDNARSLFKYGVTVTNGDMSYANCLIIAPDNFTGELQSSYTLEDVNAAGLLCLPTTGYRDASTINNDGNGYYWSGTLITFLKAGVYDLYFNSDWGVQAAWTHEFNRYQGLSVRLAKDAEGSDPEPRKLITAITIEPSTLTVKPGEEATLTVTVSPSDAANQNLMWSTTNENVAYYDGYMFTAVAPGTATITCSATDGTGVSATCTVTVVSADTPADTHDYVDLGLPSGTMWATCNVGASAPEEYGDYYVWGETTAFNLGKSTGSDKIYTSWTTYSYCEGTNKTFTKYCNESFRGTVDNKTELDVEDDAAYVNWGSNWRTPSNDQITELINSDYTTTTWTTQNGVYGRKITSNTNGNSIFMPAAEEWDEGTPGTSASRGLYWSRSLNTSSCDRAYALYFSADGLSPLSGYRHTAYSVRPVLNTEK